MKRKDKILLVSLELFNEMGEPNISSVDIANEMEISPGNLYYHFKGKEEIVERLIQRFREVIEGLVEASRREETTMAIQWTYVYFYIESFYTHRFFLRNLNDMVNNYPSAGKQLVRILALLQTRFTEVIAALAENGDIDIFPEQKNLISKLVKNIMLVVVFWESFQIISPEKPEQGAFVQDASLQILSVLAPYISDEQVRDIHQVHQAYLRDRAAL